MSGKRIREKHTPKPMPKNLMSPKPIRAMNLTDDNLLPVINNSGSRNRPQTSILLGTLDPQRPIGKKSVVPSKYPADIQVLN